MKIVLVFLLGIVATMIVMHFKENYDNKRKLAIIEKFVSAWNAHDLNTVMSLMTEQPIFYTSSGEYPFGQKYEGLSAVRDAFAKTLQKYPRGKWLARGETIFSGENVVSPFLFEGVDVNGKTYQVYGVDMWRFSGSKIAEKDGFRKFNC